MKGLTIQDQCFMKGLTIQKFRGIKNHAYLAAVKTMHNSRIKLPDHKHRYPIKFRIMSEIVSNQIQNYAWNIIQSNSELCLKYYPIKFRIMHGILSYQIQNYAWNSIQSNSELCLEQYPIKFRIMSGILSNQIQNYV